MNKYHAQKTLLEGIKFDSRHEAERYAELKATPASWENSVISDAKFRLSLSLSKTAKGRLNT